MVENIEKWNGRYRKYIAPKFLEWRGLIDVMEGPRDDNQRYSNHNRR